MFFFLKILLTPKYWSFVANYDKALLNFQKKKKNRFSRFG